MKLYPISDPKTTLPETAPFENGEVDGRDEACRAGPEDIVHVVVKREGGALIGGADVELVSVVSVRFENGEWVFVGFMEYLEIGPRQL